MLIDSVEQIKGAFENHRGRPLTPLLAGMALFLSSATTGAETDPVAMGWYLPLTRERVEALPEARRQPWLDYLARSEAMRASYTEALSKELHAAGLKSPTPGPEHGDMGSVDLRKVKDGWFDTEEGRRIVSNVISYQLPFGAWNKHVDLSLTPRPPGGSWFGGKDSTSWCGTIDNNATYTQVRLLARAWKLTGDASAADAARRGILYLVAAQSPNGGFPQVFPLSGGYHNAVTYNDNAMIGVLAVFGSIASGAAEYDFLTANEKAAGKAAYESGLRCLLESQVKRGGKPTAWGQQHDPLSLVPCGARNYEMASLTSSESATIVSFLMEIEKPSPEIKAAIHGAAAWFRKTEIKNTAYPKMKGKTRELVPTPGSSVWPRYAHLETDQPLFGDRDFSIYTDLSRMSPERRSGYAWYTDQPMRVLEAYAAWKEKHGEAK